MSAYVYRGKEADPPTLIGRTRPAPGHGTDSGYYRHRRITKTVPCDDCLQAHAAAERDRCRRKYGMPYRPKKAS